MTLLDRIGNFKDAKALFESDLRMLSEGSEEQKREAAQRHVLKVLPSAADAVNDVTIASLRQMTHEGSFYCTGLEEIDDIESLPSFEELRQNEITGTALYDRGFTVVGYRVFGDGKVVRTFSTFFNDDKTRKRAGLSQQYVSGLVEHIRKSTGFREVIDLLQNFRPISPVYNKKNVLTNIFVDTDDLHDVLSKSSPNEKYRHLREVCLFDLALAKYSNTVPVKLESVDHRKRLVDKVFRRVDCTYGRRATGEDDLIKLLSPKGEVRFCHGDALPSNTLVQRRNYDQKIAKVLGEDSAVSYIPIDFEFACLDVMEASLAQRLVKSGIYDCNGDSVKLSDGCSIEDALLNDCVVFMRKIDNSFDEVLFRENFGKLKAENYLLWAARYKHYASLDTVLNPEESKLLSKYFYTLFVSELVKQGKVESGKDAVLSYTNELFGPVLHEESMRFVFEKYHPECRSHSVLKTTFPGSVEYHLERVVRSYDQRRMRRKARNVAAFALGCIGLVAGFFGFRNAKDSIDSLTKEVEVKKGELGLKEKIKNIRLYQEKGTAMNFAEIHELEEIRQWELMFGDNMTAFAAYIDYSTVHRAIQAKGSSRWKDIDRQVYEINPNLWYAMTDTSYCVDSFVRWPDKNGKPMFKAVVEGHVAKIVSETTSQYGPLPLQGNR